MNIELIKEKMINNTLKTEKFKILNIFFKINNLL